MAHEKQGKAEDSATKLSHLTIESQPSIPGSSQFDEPTLVQPSAGATATEEAQASSEVAAETFEIEGDLVDVNGQKLGFNESLAAKEGNSAFSGKQGRVRLDGSFNEIKWGRYKSQPACLLEFGIALSGLKDFRLHEATVGIEISSKDADDMKKQRLAGVQLFPYFTPAHSLSDHQSEPTAVEKEQNLALEINANVAGSGGGIKTPDFKTTYTQLQKWTMGVGLRNTGYDAAYRRLQLEILNQKLAQQSLPPMVVLRTIIIHDMKPFYAKFDLNIVANFKEVVRDIFSLPETPRAKKPHRSFAPLKCIDELQLKTAA